MNRTLIFTATFNEADNIENLIREIFVHAPGTDILVIDDGSPDETGLIVDRLAKTNPNIHIIHRPHKLGLGSAHKLAMKYAIENQFEYLITMDADFSHHPKYLPEIIKHLSSHDFVTGSRYIPGAKSDYKFFRHFLSRGANTLARGLLGIPLHECTTSYRGFRIPFLKQLNIDKVYSDGYSFFMELIFCVHLLTAKIFEFPIYFEDRRGGTSKISKVEIIKGLLTLFRLFFKKLFDLKTLKSHIKKQDPDPAKKCLNCGSKFFTEKYPATHNGDHVISNYQCTSSGHKSHERITRCLQCGLVSLDMKISPEVFQNMYTAVEDPVYIENISARYATYRYNFSSILSCLPTSGNLLDVGSYCGAFLQIAQEYGFKTTGVEPSAWAAKYAVEKLGQKVIQGTIHDLPEGGEKYDVITLWDVLEHLPDPSHELSAMHQRLKQDGFLVLSTLNIDNWFPKIMGNRWPWYMDMHLYYFTPDSLEQVLSKAGFQIIKTQRYRHIITAEYFLSKIESLGVGFIKNLKPAIARTPLKNWRIPFQFGDIQLYVCKKI